MWLQVPVARNVAPDTEGAGLFDVHGFIDRSDDFGNPVETATQDSFHSPLQGGRGDGTARAGSLELHLNDARLHVGTNEHQVTTVGLDRGSHEIDESRQGAQAAGALGVGQGSFHTSILP